MGVLEILTFLVATVMFLLITAAAYVGVLALIGALRLVRCEGCNHLTVEPVRAAANTCLWCRHGYVRHPLQSLHRQTSQAFRRS